MQTQLAIIGGGPGGYVAAIRAAQLGLSVALIEKRNTLGGTCLNVGCIPSKALLASTEYYHFAHDRLASHGVITGPVSFDLATMMKRKEEVVSKNAKGLDFLMKKNKVERLVGTGKLLDAHTIEVTGETGVTTVHAERILLATGSAPVELPFLPFDGKRVLSSDHGIAMTSVPPRLLVIGGGAIGLELGSVWARLGSTVTVVEFLPRIAATEDADLSKALAKSLSKQGLTIHVNTKVQSAVVSDSSVVVTALREGVETTYEVDVVLVAVGRRPYTEGLGLENAGIALSDKRRVPVNSHFQTAVPNIYAIGDITEGPMLAHKAEDEGVAAAECIAGKPGHVNYEVIPSVVYTTPEAAHVGLTEEQCKEKGLAYKVGTSSFASNGRALAMDAAEGTVKIIACAQTDRVLGIHILANNASELIALGAVLMEFGGAADDLARTCLAHPTMAEAVREAAMAVNGRAIHA